MIDYLITEPPAEYTEDPDDKGIILFAGSTEAKHTVDSNRRSMLFEAWWNKFGPASITSEDFMLILGEALAVNDEWTFEADLPPQISIEGFRWLFEFSQREAARVFPSVMVTSVGYIESKSIPEAIVPFGVVWNGEEERSS